MGVYYMEYFLMDKNRTAFNVRNVFTKGNGSVGI